MQNPLCPFKKTDYRYALWKGERKAIRARAKKNRFKVEMGPQPKSRMAITVDTSKSKSTLDVVRICLKDLGWREYPMGRRDGGICDIYWLSVHFTDNPDIDTGKVNKFPGMVETVRKVNLGRTLDLMTKLFPDEFDFHPVSWFLPQQYADFCDAVRKTNEKKQAKQVYIVKPDEGSQGDGIYLIQDPKEYQFNNKHHIVQEYIANPLLMDSLKFDFRVYVVLASLDPLEIYISKEGLGRFCTVPYQFPTNKNIHEAFMHLTNYSLNKRSINYLHTESEDDGSKRTMTSIFKQLDRMGYDVATIWADIEKVVVKTLIAIAPELKVEYRAELPMWKSASHNDISCFQILGFDILLREDGTPMLLEVNANPSLRIDFEHEVAPGIPEYIHSPVDEEIKRPLVMDTLLLVAPRARSSSKIPHSDGRNPRPKPPPEDDYAPPPRPGHRGFGSLTQVYPRTYAATLDRLRVLDRTADIFLDCLGVRGALRMGSTGFRTFARKCRLTSSGNGFPNAALDIMYIDLQRRWEHVNPDRTSGICFQGFIEAFLLITRKRFASRSMLDSVEDMLDYCETSMELEPRGPVSLPKLTPAEKRAHDIKSIYGSSGRKKFGSSYFIDYKKFPVEKRPKPLRMKSFSLQGKEAREGRVGEGDEG